MPIQNDPLPLTSDLPDPSLEIQAGVRHLNPEAFRAFLAGSRLITLGLAEALAKW